MGAEHTGARIKPVEQPVAAGNASFVLRPGVLMPDWSFVNDASARAALSAVMMDAGRAEKWAGLDPAEDRVWQAVLRGFAATGRAPDAWGLAVVTGLEEFVVADWLRSLRRRDLIVLYRDDALTAPYPFCPCAPRHP